MKAIFSRHLLINYRIKTGEFGTNYAEAKEFEPAKIGQMEYI